MPDMLSLEPETVPWVVARTSQKSRAARQALEYPRMREMGKNFGILRKISILTMLEPAGDRSPHSTSEPRQSHARRWLQRLC